MDESRVSGRPPSWLIVLLGLSAVAMSLRVYFAAGFIAVDDAEYARAAAQFLNGTFSWANHPGPPVNPGRLGIVLPLMATFAVFGPNEISMAVFPLLLSLLTVILVYLFTAKTFNRFAGLLAVGLWAFMPLDIEFAAKPSPDTAVTAYAALALFVIYCARRRDDLTSTALFLRGAGAGVSFGVGWLCKAAMVYFAPFCLAILIVDLLRDHRRLVWLWGGVAVGSVAVFSLEMIYYFATTGDWLYRFYTIEQNYQMFPQYFFNEGARWGYEAGTPYWKAVVKRLFLDGPATFFLRDDYMYLPTIGLVASAYGLYKKDRRFYFMTLLFASLLFMFNFFSASLTNYQPLPLFTRYSHSLGFVGVLLTAGLLSTLLPPYFSRAALARRPDELFWGVVVFSVLFIAAGWSTFRKARDISTTWAAAERYLAGVLTPDDRIYTDPLSRAGLEFFWRYPREMNIVNLSEVEPGSDLGCGGHVLLNNNYVSWLTNNFGMWYTFEPFELPPEALEPPTNWAQTWTNGNARLYRIDCT